MDLTEHRKHETEEPGVFASEIRFHLPRSRSVRQAYCERQIMDVRCHDSVKYIDLMNNAHPEDSFKGLFLKRSVQGIVSRFRRCPKNMV